jgi:thiol-disulfide isomerase/thioredoxin
LGAVNVHNNGVTELENVYSTFGDFVVELPSGVSMSNYRDTYSKGLIEGNTLLCVHSWNCPACRKILPQVIKLARTVEGKKRIRVISIVIDPGNYKAALSLRVPMYPYFIGYKNGERVYERGAFDAVLLKQFLS